MKATLRKHQHLHTGDLSHIWTESVMAALVLTLSMAATGVALMFLVGKLNF